MNSFTTIEKYAIVKVLSHIMKADGIIHPKEEEYMDQTYSDFSITIHDLEDISNIDDIQTKLIICGIEKLFSYTNSITDNLYQIKDENKVFELINI